MALRLFARPSELLAAFSIEREAGRSVPLCIVDMRMPEQSGLELSVALRHMDPEISIIICSAFSDATADTLKERLNAGVFLVHKPFAADEFKLLVHSLLREWEGRRTLKRNEERLRRIIEATRVGTWEWNVQTGRLIINERWAEIIGHSLESLAPIDINTWNSLVHPDDGARSNDLVQRHFSGELEFYEIECRMQHRDGRWVWVHAHGQVVERDACGAPLWMSGTHSDISDRKGAEAELLAMNYALQESNANAQALAKTAMEANSAKSSFLANMSHEIRTPLTAIIGFSDIVRGGELSQEQRMHVETIVSSSHLLLSIINDILDFSKIESGKISLESIDIDPRRIMAELMAMFENRVAPTTVRLSSRIESEVPETVSADPTRLKQVMINLLSNAVKFTKKGEIVAGVAREVGTDGRAQLRFSVKDSGIGIPRDRQGMIFDAFEQADGSTTRKYGGTGLGLAISRSLVMLMGGAISVESEPDKGSTFSFTVPIVAASRGSLPRPGSRNRSLSDEGLKGLRVLVAEDVATNRMLLGAILKAMGCETEFATDGIEALEALRRKDFDICLMDVQMPRMGGVEATKAAKSEGLATPIVALTAAASTDDAEACRLAGMEAFVTKPIDRQNLISAMLAVTGKKPS
ncbi:MAG: response regulator [Spirochaetota bacterium]